MTPTKEDEKKFIGFLKKEGTGEITNSYTVMICPICNMGITKCTICKKDFQINDVVTCKKGPLFLKYHYCDGLHNIQTGGHDDKTSKTAD